MTNLKCNRCGHEWKQRLLNTPIHCAKCDSPYWNKKRKYIKHVNKEEVKATAKSSVGPGWHNLLNNLIDELYKLRWDGRLIRIVHWQDGMWFQVKKGISQEMWELIRAAEIESCSRCEQCGKPCGRKREQWLTKCHCETST